MCYELKIAAFEWMSNDGKQYYCKRINRKIEIAIKQWLCETGSNIGCSKLFNKVQKNNVNQCSYRFATTIAKRK